MITTWPSFIRDLEIRFGPSSYTNHQHALFKLTQPTTVADYQKEFERICNRVVGLSPTTILDCFVSGLRWDIKNEIALLQPTTISQAIGLAKLIESKLLATRPNTSSSHNKPYYQKPAPSQITYTPQTTNNPLLPNPPTRLTLPAPPNPKSTMPVRRLSPDEMQIRRTKGLCFNCDERFVPGHKCKTRPFLLLLSDDPNPPPSPTHTTEEDVFFLTESTTTPPNEPVENTNPAESVPTTPENFHLSLHALTTHTTF